MALPLSKEARWIFIGDSITDAGRGQCPEAVGTGYVRDIRDWLRASVPARAPQILNKGISGNTIRIFADAGSRTSWLMSLNSFP